MSSAKDYTGTKFNKLMCKERIVKNGKTHYKFQCDCGNIIEVLPERVVSGVTKSCGKCHCTYDVSGEYGIGYTRNGEEFYFDKEDFDLIKPYNWSKTSHGYIRTTINGKAFYMHHLFITNSNGSVTDHKNMVKHDNRKCNLRVATRSENAINQRLRSTNDSGTTGVYFDKERGKWAVQIGKGKNTFSLGRYDSKEEAIRVRIEKELELYEGYSPCSI